jgi:tRNA pseudouridine55 synthase
LPASSDGVLLLDKPAGVTSHDVVASVRRRLGRGVKVGHAGTLDPFATGLLLVLVGRATRVQRFLMALPKRYETVARLGWTSTTGDPEGEIAPGHTPSEPFTLPTGRILQRPPAYSAVKVGGQRAYKLARRGEVVELAEREVEVSRFEQLWREGERAAFAIECSSGTYVRSLVADLGDAYCLELRRTAIGPFDVRDAVAPPDRDAAAGSCSWAPRVLGLAEALRDVLPVVAVDEPLAARAGHGQVVGLPAAADAAPAGDVLLVDQAGDPVCVADVTDGRAKPRVGFRA